jgi:hypothetical protein
MVDIAEQAARIRMHDLALAEATLMNRPRCYVGHRLAPTWGVEVDVWNWPPREPDPRESALRRTFGLPG